MISIALLVLAALLSVVAVEGGVIAWLNLASYGVDLTGNFFLFALAPVVLVVTLVMGLLFGRVFAVSPKIHGTLYLVFWLALHAATLALMGNPIMDIARYCDTIVIVAGLTLVLHYFTHWRTRA